MSAGWTRYYDATGEEPRETLLLALEKFDAENRSGLAVDLGCGAGRDTAELLRRGWSVLAIDGEEEAIARLKRRALTDDERVRLGTQIAASSLREGGRFSGQLFGNRDEWANDPALTFHARTEAEELLDAFELEHFSEVEEDSTTAIGDPKHWHVFHVVARRR